MPKLHLPEVTLACADCVNPQAALRALTRSMEQCTFREALLFTDADVAAPPGIEICRIAPLKHWDDYSRFMLKELGTYVPAGHALVIQWDGFVVDADRWRPEFLDYDYIGSRWPTRPSGSNIGNGGFSLRSAHLMRTLADDRFPATGQAEDALIGLLFRPILEQDYGVVFATDEIADAFSYERIVPVNPTFGFHGPNNLLRYLDTKAMLELIDEIADRTLATATGVDLMVDCLGSKRLVEARAVFRRLDALKRGDQFLPLIAGYFNGPEELAIGLAILNGTGPS